MIPPPHYEDLFPPGCTPFCNPNTHLHPSFTRLPTPSIPLDPPPLYDSLFATAVPPDSAVALQISQIIGVTLIHGIQMLGQTGTCSSSPPHPHTLFYYIILLPLFKTHQKGYIELYRSGSFSEVGQICHNM